jgi:hypothetical protein
MKLFFVVIGLGIGSSSVSPKNPLEYIRGMLDDRKTREDVYFEYKARFGSDSIKWEEFLHFWHLATTWSEDEALEWIDSFLVKNPRVSFEDTFEAFDQQFGATPIDLFSRIWRRRQLPILAEEGKKNGSSSRSQSPAEMKARSRSDSRGEEKEACKASSYTESHPRSSRGMRLELIRQNWNPRLSGRALFEKLLPLMKEKRILSSYGAFKNDHSMVRCEMGFKREYIRKPSDQKKWLEEQLKGIPRNHLYEGLKEQFGEKAMTRPEFDKCMQDIRGRSSQRGKKENKTT